MSNKYTFHLLLMGHLPANDLTMGCAYSQKCRKLSQMLMNAGHTVYAYGAESSDIKCTEFVQVVSLSDIRNSFGDGDNRFPWGYNSEKSFYRTDWNQPPSSATIIFYANAIKEINKRKKDDDFLLCTMGNWNKPIADGVNLFLTCEPGIGYTGSWTKYRAFESSYMQNFTYGKYSTVDSPSGNNYDVVIPNYFNVTDFKFQERKGDYFLYIGRMIVRKGILTAVEVCKKLGAKLILAGQGGRVENGIFYGEDFNTPMLPNMEYVGYADKEKRSELMGGAKACFVCTDYLEPFGGVSIESLLCGTPVITTNYGCFPETIPHGEVGYRCQTLDQFVWAAKNIDKINPKRCRKYAEQNYSTERISKIYGTWFTSLYHLYLSAKGAEQEGWYYVDSERGNLDWLNKY